MRMVTIELHLCLCLTIFLLGEHTLSFKIDSDDGNINCVYSVTFTTKNQDDPETEPEPEPEPIVGFEETDYVEYTKRIEEERNNLGADDAVVIVQQEKTFGRKVIYNWQDKPLQMNLVSDYEFEKNKNIEIFLFTKEIGLDETGNSLEASCSNTTNVAIHTTVELGAGGFGTAETNYMYGRVKIKINKAGSYTINVKMTGDGVNIDVNLTIKIGDTAKTLGSILNIPQEVATSEDILGDNGLRVVIGTASGVMPAKNYHDIEDIPKTINIVASEVFGDSTFKNGSSIHVFVYWENIGQEETGNEFGLIEGETIKNAVGDTVNGATIVKSEWKTDGLNGLYGNMVLKITSSNIQSIKIPICFKAKQNDDKIWTFYINIKASEDDRNREDRGNTVFTDVLTDIGSYIPILSTDGVGKLEEKAGTILKVITNIGTIIAVLMSAVIGVKYMLGSVEEKAEFKKDMLPYLIGSLMLFGICTIVSILQSVGNSINYEHTYGQTVIVTSATCTTPGVGKMTCVGGDSGCNCSVSKPTITTVAIPIDSDAHNMSDWSITQNETCTENGTETKTCRNGCGKTETRTKNAKGHEYEAKIIRAACTEEGYKCDKCKNCGEELNIEKIAAVGHAYEEVITKQATCTETGKKVQKCKNCGHETAPETIATVVHAYEKVIIKQVTCTENGTKADVCKNCNNQINEETITAVGHSYGEWSITDATCTNNGSKTRTCSGCSGTETVTIEKLGHNYDSKRYSYNGFGTNKHHVYDVCSRCNGEVCISIDEECDDSGFFTATCRKCNNKR